MAVHARSMARPLADMVRFPGAFEGARAGVDRCRARGIQKSPALSRTPRPLARAAVDASPQVRVVVLGQDPYHGARQAHGLAFSVQDPLLPWPPSLRNMFKERHADLGLPMDRPADLSDWAQQGVLLLNSALTTEAGTAGQHQNLGWERAVVHALASLCAVQPRLVWVLWGKSAERVHGEVLDCLEGERKEDVCLRSPHPSPLSAYRGFFGSRPFSQANDALQAWGGAPIQW